MFEAFFADDEPEKKKKKPAEPAVPVSPAAAVAEIVATPAAVEPAKPAVKKTSVKKTTVKKTVTPSKKVTVVTSTEQIEASSSVSPTLGFQHTPALLELAQTSDKKDTEPTKTENTQAINEITGQLLETNKMEESENQLVDALDDNDDESQDNMIIISSSEGIMGALYIPIEIS